MVFPFPKAFRLLPFLLLVAGLCRAADPVYRQCVEASIRAKNFGAVEIGQKGVSAVRLTNRCSYGVSVGWTSVYNAQFAASIRGAFRVPASGATDVQVTFRPSKAGPQRGLVIFRMGGFGRRDLRVALIGNGLQPGMTVTPFPLQRVLPPGTAHTAWIQVGNGGTERIEAITSVTGAFPSHPMHVLFYHTDPQPAPDFLAALRAMHGVASVDVMDGLKETPTVEDLLDYDLVLCNGIAPFPGGGVAAGDALADYMDKGGKLLLMGSAIASSGGLGGRLVALNPDYRYLPVGPTVFMGEETQSQTLASHPITSGVGTFGTSLVGDVQRTSWAPATLGTYANGDIIGAWNHNLPVVFLNFPASDKRWSGDAMKLVSNTLSFLAEWNAWFQADREIYVVEPGATRAFPIAFNTFRLDAGFYRGYLRLEHNAARTVSPYELPVTVEVPSKRCISASPDTLDFGEVFAGGHYKKTIKLRNRCNEATHVDGAGFGSSAPFSLATTFPLVIPPFAFAAVEVGYAPGAIHEDAADLEIRSDASGLALFRCAVKGKAVAAPALSVDPDHFDVTLSSGESARRTFAITNGGGASMAVRILARAEGASPLPDKLNLLWYGTSTPDDVSRNFTDEVATLPNVAGIKIKNGENFTPDLAYLQSYDMVVVDCGNAFGDAKAVGDVLADFVDRGGRIVITGFCLAGSSSGANLAGRIVDPKYLPVAPAKISFNDSLGREVPITVENHPITDGVKALYSKATLEFKDVVGDGRPLGHWANGRLIGAYSASKPIVVLNWNTVDGDWQHDYPTLIGNSFEHLRGFASWLRVDPSAAVIPAGGSKEVTVWFDARGLPSGPRSGALDVANDAGLDTVKVPVSLTVTPGAM
jgi:hypothetical protein